ncbi:MAG TPA: NAD(P)H-hydrate dehydratase [Thermoleophilia bacterium]|nr:NAD(P)H-hydrate dehydratase [Thermoleophilia bacterium]
MDESLLIGLYTADAMRQIDTAAIQGVGIPSGHLMERAGMAVAREILERYEPEAAVVVVGKGNNGGDGLVVARELFEAGVDVSVLTLPDAGALSSDAQLNREILDRIGVDVFECLDAACVPAREALEALLSADVVVDALFGTGFTGAAKGTVAVAIALINEAPGTVVSVDIASGVGAGSGVVHGPAVIADLTVALHAAKIGHFVTPGGIFSGEVVVAPIGIPSGCNCDAEVLLLTEAGLEALFVPKGALDHKRSVGTVLVVGGSRGMTGAAHMTAMAALRSGAGLVHVALPQGAGGEKPYPEVITVEVPGADGQFAMAGRSALFAATAELQAVAMGPGLGRADEARLLVRELVGVERPLLLDADALYALGDRPELLAERTAPTVLTPHEGELGRLLGLPSGDVAAQRLECARSAAQRSGATVVLKGEGTIVADPSGRAYVVPTGNPGLATPGTGDVLSGVITAHLAKGLAPTDAACLGAYLHGLAADLAAESAVGTEGMIASDLFQFLPAAAERLKAGPREEAHVHH